MGWKKTECQLVKGPKKAYFIYNNKQRVQYSKEHPEASYTEVSRAVGENWKALSSEEKQEYEDQATEDRVRYDREVAEHGGHEAMEEKRKQLLASKPVKRPMGTFFLWMQDNRERIKAEKPDMTGQQFAKVAGEEYKAMSPEEKEKYEEQNRMMKVQYEKDVAEQGQKAYPQSAGPPSKKVDAQIPDIPNLPKKAADKADKNAAPQKAQSAYMLYVTDNKEKFKEDNPNFTIKELSNFSRTQWKNATDKVKQQYKKAEDKDKVRYEKAKTKWDKKQAKGDASQSATQATLATQENPEEDSHQDNKIDQENLNAGEEIINK